MTYYFNQSDLEKYLAEYKELKNIEKELLKENKLANNYDLYEQYMSKIQTYYFDENIEYAKIYANTKEELIEKTREYLKDIYGLDGYELLEYEEALQKAYINFIGQGYYQIYNSIGCSGDISVHRIDEMLKIALSSAMMKYEFDDEGSSPIFCVKIPLVRTKCFYHHRLAYYTASDPLGVKDTLSLGFAALDTRGLRRIRILTGGDRLSYLNYFFL